MKHPDKLITNFDKLLLAGTAFGALLLCVVLGVFLFLWQNPPRADERPAPADGLGFPTLDPIATATTTLAIESPLAPALTVLPTLTVVAAQPLAPTPIPSPAPGSWGDTPPVGKIVYTCFIKQIDQICIMNADGSGQTQLTFLDATAFYASLSPDGKTIYFSSRASGIFEIYSIRTDGTDMKRLTNNIGGLYAPELSPDGSRIVFTNGSRGLWIMKADGSNPRALTDRPDLDPTWSPDGSMIAFASARAGARQLFVMNADGSNPRQVTFLENMGGRNTWSADGTQLAFYAGPFGDRNIYVINIDGTGLRQLTNGGDNLGPSWSPDGNWIAFTSFRDGNNEIYIMRPDGSNPTRLTSNLISEWQPRWGR
jgi:TolB protein